MVEPSRADEVIAGKYRLSRLIGQGGMGSVWEGVHTTLGTRVAIKFIEKEFVDSDEARKRFVNEARAAARLSTKHVVDVYDQGVTEDGRPYIVMEYLHGEALDQRLQRVGCVSPDETARILIQVCRALTKAHDNGIVHRDLKPENVFLVHDEEDGTEIVKVVDFGIAKFTDASMGLTSSTRTGSVLGTPYFMSPEQARGLRSVDHRSDLWSVGVIAYRCLVGQLPFSGEAVGDLLVKICTAPLPVPSALKPDLPPGFDAWFARCLAREPDERFQTARELGEALASALGYGGRMRVGSAANLPAYTESLPSAPRMSAPPAPGQMSSAKTEAAFTHTPTMSGKKPPLLVVGAVAGVLLLMGVVGVLIVRSALAGPEPEVVTNVVAEPTVAGSLPVEEDVVGDPAPSAEPATSDSAEPPQPPAEPAVEPSSKPVTVRRTTKPTTKPTAKPTGKPNTSEGIDLGY